MTFAGRGAAGDTPTDHRKAVGRGRRFLVVVGLLLIGACLRLTHYVANRSLVLDEALLALNVIRRDAGGLLETLDWNQGGPVAFLLIENAATELFGFSELVLRAYPFVAAILSLGLFGLLAVRVLSPVAAMLAVAYFAVLPALVAYAAITKQYSGDVLLGCLIMILAVRAVALEYRTRGLVVLGLVGLAAPLISHASAFYVVAASASLLVGAWRRQKRATWIRVAWIVGTWAAAFVVVWLLQREALEALADSWGMGFASLEELRNSVGELRKLFAVESSSGSVELTDLGALAIAALAGIGAVHLARRAPEVAVLVVTPVAAAGCASVVGLYPLATRTLLFAAPSLILLVAAGGGRVAERAVARAGDVIALAGFAFAFAFALVAVVSDLPRPPFRDDGIRRAMEQLANVQRRSDTLFLNVAAQYPFAYYLSCGCAPRAIEEARRDGLWRTRPIDGTSAQFAPALQASDRVRVEVFKGFTLEGLDDDLMVLEGRPRVWALRTFLRPADRVEFDEALARRSLRVRTPLTGEQLDSATLSLHNFSE